MKLWQLFYTPGAVFTIKNKKILMGSIIAIVLTVVGCLLFVKTHFNESDSEVVIQPKQNIIEVNYKMFSAALNSCTLSKEGVLTGSEEFIANIIADVDTVGMKVTATSIKLTKDEKDYIKMPTQLLTNMIDHNYVKSVLNK